VNFLGGGFEVREFDHGWDWRARITTEARRTQRGEAATESSAGFQPAVSPTSSRQTLDVIAAFELFPRLQIGNPRYSRLEALRYGDGLVSPKFPRGRRAIWTIVVQRKHLEICEEHKDSLLCFLCVLRGSVV
jgi:hypothetical protein